MGATVDELAERIETLDRLKEVEDFPRTPRLKSVARLKGTSDPWFKMRIGELRILFRRDKNKRIIFVEKIGWRENVY